MGSIPTAPAILSPSRCNEYFQTAVASAAFKHEDGEGYNLILQAMPIGNGDGTYKIVLRPPKDDEDKSGAGWPAAV